jgi:hypothetical protein
MYGVVWKGVRIKRRIQFGDYHNGYENKDRRCFRSGFAGRVNRRC